MSNDNTRLRKLKQESAERLREAHKRAEPPFKFYWAYGSNLCKEHMLRRCPAARAHGPLLVDDAQLLFRGHADVIHSVGNVAAGGLWKITPACERSLDRYEGVASGAYAKKYMRIRYREKEYPVLYYKMLRKGIMPPKEHYLDTIIKGYRDFDLDVELLHDAHMRAHAEKAVNDYLAERAQREGRMAAPDFVERRTGNRFDRVKTLLTMGDFADCGPTKH